MTDMAQGKSHCDTNGNSNNSKGQVINSAAIPAEALDPYKIQHYNMLNVI